MEAFVVVALALGWAGTTATLYLVAARLRGVERRLAQLETRAYTEAGRVLH